MSPATTPEGVGGISPCENPVALTPILAESPSVSAPVCFARTPNDPAPHHAPFSRLHTGYPTGLSRTAFQAAASARDARLLSRAPPRRAQPPRQLARGQAHSSFDLPTDRDREPRQTTPRAIAPPGREGTFPAEPRVALLRDASLIVQAKDL